MSDRNREMVQPIQEALERFVSERGFEGMLGDWVTFGTIVRVDDDGDLDGEYFVVMTGGSLLQHVVLGLVEKGKDVLITGDKL